MSVRAFVINLDRSPDRLHFMQAQAERHGLPFERVPAVDGYDVPDEFARYFAHYRTGEAPLLAPGAIGCYASHIKTWRIIRDRGLPFAMVMEDDAEFDDDIVAALAGALTTLPPGWDFVNLSGRTPQHACKPLARVPYDRHLVRYSRVP